MHEDFRNRTLAAHGDFLRDKVFAEFGVYDGGSFLRWKAAYKRYGITARFMGFDSFTGLPAETQDKNTIWHANQFSMNGRISQELADNYSEIELVQGYYSDSLTPNVAARLGDTKIGIVHMDCDLYGSTKTVWEWLLKHDLLVAGTIIVYDDWGAYKEAGCDEYEVGEAKAHREIEAEHDLKFTPFDRYIVDPRFYVVQSFRYWGKNACS